MTVNQRNKKFNLLAAANAAGVAEDGMSKTAVPVEKLNYEQALAELEEITRQLEENPPALEVMLALFERGQRLAAHCAELLDNADLKVRQLSGDELAHPEGE
jgi:exodeoxyribonuclease VII small subunit